MFFIYIYLLMYVHFIRRDFIVQSGSLEPRYTKEFHLTRSIKVSIPHQIWKAKRNIQALNQAIKMIKIRNQ